MRSLIAVLCVLTVILAGCGVTPESLVEGHSYLTNVGNDSVTFSFHRGIESVKMGQVSKNYEFTIKDRIITDSTGDKFQVSADGMTITGVVGWEGRTFKRIE
jgi:hypothetical protein